MNKDIRENLKRFFGPKFTAININKESDIFINIPSHKMTFCEAVYHSLNVPIRLNSDNLNCLGAQRSFGYRTNNELLVKEISRHSLISESYISDTLLTIPVMTGIRHLNMGLTESMENYIAPDIYIIYMQPYKITGLIHNLTKLEIKPSIPPYSFLSICGNVFVNCYLNQVVSISFGCTESRKRGRIGKNEIVVGLPFKIASELLKVYEYNKS